MNTEWLNMNRYRAFPFREDSVFAMTDSNDTRQLPNWCLCDMTVVDTTSEKKTMKLVSATVDGAVTLTFRYGDEEFTLTTGSDYVIGTETLDSGVLVRYVLGYGEATFEGTYAFESPPELLPTRILHIAGGEGVQSIVAGEVEASGVVHLKPGCNCDLRIYDGQLHVDVTLGGGVGKCCSAESVDSCLTKLLFINGQTADTNGNINISGDSGIIVGNGGTSDIVYNGVTIRGIPTIVVKPNSALKALAGLR